MTEHKQPQSNPTEVPEAVKAQYPDLSETDFALIYRQCELQSATSERELAGFTRAYDHAKRVAASISDDTTTPADIIDLVLLLGTYTDSLKNSNGFRLVPATFASGDSALPARLIPDSITKWAEAFKAAKVTPDELYKEFEEIHPFADGNGRVGDLLWKIATQRVTGTWPEEIPPDLFGENAKPAPYESAFGALE